MITLNRDDRDLLVRAHRWARANGWTYDATTLDHSLTDFRWRKNGTSVIVRMDHEMPSPWQLEVAVPRGASAEATLVSVRQTAAVLAALDVLPSSALRHLAGQQAPGFDVLTLGMFSATVCTSLSDEDATARVSDLPSGSAVAWRLSTDPVNAPVPCDDEPITHRHLRFES